MLDCFATVDSSLVCVTTVGNQRQTSGPSVREQSSPFFFYFNFVPHDYNTSPKKGMRFFFFFWGNNVCVHNAVKCTISRK